MAETAEDTIKAVDVPESEVNVADITEGAGEPTQDVNAGAEKSSAVKDETTTSEAKPTSDSKDEAGDANGATDDATSEEKPSAETTKDEKSGSSSPQQKRKSEHVSISAHDRDNSNKRFNRGDRQNGNSRGGSNRRNIKTNFEDQPESSDADEIRRQVEFYFSDSNLPIDAYLLSHTGGAKNNPVPLKVIHGFKRMRHFQPYDAVRKAVAESKFLVLSEDDELTRKYALSEKFTDDPNQNRSLVHTSSMNRSIYAKGFGEESGTTHLDVETFFAPYGPTQSVRLRRKEDGAFKGSAFIEFEDEETQQRFLELDPKPQWGEGDKAKDLEIMSKQEYVDMKHQGIIDGVVRPKSPQLGGRGGSNNGGGFRGRGGGGGGQRGGREWVPADEWNKRREQDQRGGNDRNGGGGRGRGGSRGGDRGGSRGGNRGGQRGRGDRRRSPQGRDEKRRRESGNGGDDKPKLSDNQNTDGDAARDQKAGPEADAGAAKAAKVEAKENGTAAAVAEGKADAPPAAAAKKRAHEGDGEDSGAAKKAKSDDA